MNPGIWDKHCKSFDWKIKVEWFDKVGLHEMKNGLVAELTLSDLGYSDYYKGFLVRIISASNGVLASHNFTFSNYLDHATCKGADHRNASSVKQLYLWHYQDKVEWYILSPADSRPYCEAVEKYIATWARVKR